MIPFCRFKFNFILLETLDRDRTLRRKRVPKAGGPRKIKKKKKFVTLRNKFTLECLRPGEGHFVPTPKISGVDDPR